MKSAPPAIFADQTMQHYRGMFLLGAGIDLVENERVLRMLERWGRRFTHRVFLPRERKYCDAKRMPHIHYAARFAAKEAVAKAFGTGIGPLLGWQDIEVLRDGDSGAPSVGMSVAGQRLMDEKGAASIMISLSHTRQFSVAQALLCGHQDDDSRG